MINSPYQKYKQSSVQTATPSQLLLKLYDGAIRFIKLGIEGIEERHYDKANTNLCKAQAVINELVASLNMDYEISKSLSRVYEYFLYQLIQANIKKNIQPANEVLVYMQELRETWDMAGKSLSEKQGFKHA